MTIKDLKGKEALLARAFNSDAVIMGAALELIEKGKIAKPEKLFKDSASKLDAKGYQDFMYLNMGKKQYFLYGGAFPIGIELTNQLKKLEKELTKAKGGNVELLASQVYFLQELDKLSRKIKGYATGEIKHSRTEGDTCFMEVKTGVTVSGQTKKNSLASDVKEIGYELAAKNGQILEFEPVLDENQESAAVETASTEVDATPSAQDLAANFTALSEKFKTIRANEHNSIEVKKLYKHILKWQKYYGLLSNDHQQRLAQHAAKMEQILEGTKKIIKADQILERDVDQIVEMLDEYGDNPSEPLHDEILRLVKNVEKIATSLSFHAILESIAELRAIMAFSFS
ncbi:hypothetical protein [Aureispira anguillae]|uniref:Uncharacterized protein n=1 Tax=Aureispira anguillae TaxID=2864201 RepID=A0A915YLF1_9BACT|nr:hypothetical protein [Aureispira anguillae]BDS15395.1 hypothetical protein AsAng_0061790 [Aureispira anguillae]